MAEEKDRHSGYKWMKGAGYGLLVLLLLAGGLRFYLTTDHARKWVKQGVIALSESYINGQLHIGAVQGDLWREASFNDIRLENRAGAVVGQIDRLQADYALWTLIGGIVEIPQMSIVRPRFEIRRDTLGRWNTADLFRYPETDTTASYFGFDIRNFTVSDGRLVINPFTSPADSAYHLRRMDVSATAKYDGRDFAVRLQKLQFQTFLPVLSDTLRMRSSGSYTGRRVTLEQMILTTGRSAWEADVVYKPGSNQIDLRSLLQPLQRKDLQALSGVNITEDLNAELSLKGRLSAFQAGLHLQAPSIKTFSIETAVRWDTTLAVKQVKVRIHRFDGPALTANADLTLPSIKKMKAGFQGHIPVFAWEKGHLKGSVTGSGWRYGDYQADSVFAALDYRERESTVKGYLKSGKQEARLQLDASHPADSKFQPRWSLRLQAGHVRPQDWLGTNELKGVVNGQLRVSGVGILPEKEKWDFSFTARDSRLAGQPIRRWSVEGTINADRIKADTRLRLDGSSMEGSFALQDYTKTPSYQFKVSAADFDIAEIKGLEQNKSRLRVSIQGEGRGISIGDMRLRARMSFDSSSVNGARISQMHGMVQVRDTILTVRNAELVSEMADGTFSLRQHLFRFYDKQNRLDLDIRLKDVGPLASLVGAGQLSALGDIEGHIRPSRSDQLQFTGMVDLHRFAYDQVLQVDTLHGDVQVKLDPNPEFQMELAVENPKVRDVVLEDVNLTAEGRVRNYRADGSFTLQINSGTGARWNQKGSFRIMSDTADIITRALTLQTPLRELRLDSPFSITYRRETVSMDTMRLSGGGAFLEMAVPQIDSTRQRGYIKADQIDLKALQEVLLNQHFVGGLFTGFLRVDKVRRQVEMSSNMQIADLTYKNVKIDSVHATSSIDNHLFHGGIQVRVAGDQIVKGAVELPFRLGDPETFPDEFFKQKVQGYLEVNPVRINEIEGAGQLLGFKKTDGTVKFRGVLRGTAGMPVFTGFARMREGHWSGVPIDTASLQFNYRHDLKQVNVESRIVSLGQQAARIETMLPMYLDLRNWSAQLDRQSDEFRLFAYTDDFDLSALNEFVDRSELRDLQGWINGKLLVDGTLADPSMDGTLRLDRGRVQLPKLGVTYGGIEALMEFKDDLIQLRQLQVKNGGSLQAEGSLKFKGPLPVNMNLKLTARNFKAAHNRNFQFVVDSDAHLTGDLTSPSVSGNLVFKRGYYYLPNFGEQSVEPVNLESVDQVEPLESEVYDSLKISMNVGVRPEFSIRNQRYAKMEVSLEGELDIAKETGGVTRVFGTVEGRNGYIHTLGKRFNMKTARIQFIGDANDPRLDMRFTHHPPQPKEEIVISYIVEGTLQDPKFSYESDPPMELENIISYTLFGQPYYALNSWKQMVAQPQSGNIAANMLTEAILNRVETLATRKLGVDVVEIQTNPGGSGGGTSIKTGWYLNERTFLAILNQISGSTPTTSVILEYMLRRNLELIITQGGVTGEGVDLHWHKDY